MSMFSQFDDMFATHVVANEMSKTVLSKSKFIDMRVAKAI